jgi:hypothetical protein
MQIRVRRTTKSEPILWIADSEQWPRALMRAELIERGYDPLGFIRIHDALEAYTQGMSPIPEAIVLELRGQELTVQTVEEIVNLKVPTILLGGDLELRDPVIAARHWHAVLKRPFSIGQVADLIQRLVPVPAHHNERIA